MLLGLGVVSTEVRRTADSLPLVCSLGSRIVVSLLLRGQGPIKPFSYVLLVTKALNPAIGRPLRRRDYHRRKAADREVLLRSLNCGRIPSFLLPSVHYPDWHEPLVNQLSDLLIREDIDVQHLARTTPGGSEIVQNQLAGLLCLSRALIYIPPGDVAGTSLFNGMPPLAQNLQAKPANCQTDDHQHGQTAATNELLEIASAPRALLGRTEVHLRHGGLPVRLSEPKSGLTVVLTKYGSAQIESPAERPVRTIGVPQC